MKKIIALSAILLSSMALAGPVLLPAPEFRAAIKIPDKPTAVACDYGSIKAAVRLGLITPAPSVIEAVAGCSKPVAAKYSVQLNRDSGK